MQPVAPPVAREEPARSPASGSVKVAAGKATLRAGASPSASRRARTKRSRPPRGQASSATAGGSTARGKGSKAQWGATSFEAEVVRLIPGGTTQLPSAALGTAGGGSVAVDPRDSSGRETLQRVFEMEVRMPEGFASEYLGRRMHVRIDHGLNPIGLQIYRTLRQLFLRQFGV